MHHSQSNATYTDAQQAEAFAILCACLGADRGATADTTEHLRQLPASTWEAVAHAARRERVASMLYDRLGRLGLSDALPPATRDPLKRDYLTTAARNTRNFHRLGVVLRALSTAGVPTILLKGAYLAEVVYGNIGLRSMNDMDILVPMSDIERLPGILAPVEVHPVPYASVVDRQAHSVVYRGPQDLFFEFHWDLLNATWAARFDVAALWDAARDVEIGGVPTHTLSPEDLLIHLCVHQFAHWRLWGLRGLCDISRTVQHFGPEMDWAAVAERSAHWQMERCVYLALRLASDLLAVPLPAGWLESLRPPGLPETAVSMIVHRLTMPDQFWRYDAVAFLWSRRSLGRKLLRVWHGIVPPRMALSRVYRVPANSPRMLLCYPRRWVDNLGRLGAVGWRMVKGEPDTYSAGERNNQWMQLREYLFKEEVRGKREEVGSEK